MRCTFPARVAIWCTGAGGAMLGGGGGGGGGWRRTALWNSRGDVAEIARASSVVICAENLSTNENLRESLTEVRKVRIAE